MNWHVDEFLFFRGFVWLRGWITREDSLRHLFALTPSGQIIAFTGSLGLPSPDVEANCGDFGKDSRFYCYAPVRTSADAMNLRIIAECESGAQIELESFRSTVLSTDGYHALQATFFSMLSSRRGRILELGSRNRSGMVRKDLVPEHLQYVGLDILPGENVDVVGDAHELSHLFPEQSFTAVFATSVFEHLMMPWKVVLELNWILATDGLVMLSSHQAWPLHEVPWDYWRFSDQAWRALFNPLTGFEVLQTRFGERCSIVPHFLHAPTQDLDQQPSFCGSAVLCRKIGKTNLRWDVRIRELTDTMYPA
jgi:hypothetical protein